MEVSRMDKEQFKNDIVCTARRWIGTNYCHQASLEGVGADCLGLLRGVWRELLGQEPTYVPSYSADWSVGDCEMLLRAARSSLKPIELATAEPGDVVLFRMIEYGPAKHLGILAKTADEAPTFIHAYSRRGVIETAMTSSWLRRVDSYYSIPLRSN